MFPYLLNFLPRPPPDPARPFGPARLGQEGIGRFSQRAHPARGQPPDGAYRPRPEINPEQGRWLQKIGKGVGLEGRRLSAGFRSFSERLIHLKNYSSLRSNRTRNPTGMECLDLSRSLTTGGPLHAAPYSRVYVSPDWTRRPALPGDVMRERIQCYPVIIRIFVECPENR
jgi:hypothetical protein